LVQFKRSIYHRVALYSLLLLSIALAQAAADILTQHEMSQNSVALERNWLQGAGDVPGAANNATDKAAALLEAYKAKGLARATAEARAAHRTMLFDLMTALLCVSFAALMQCNTVPAAISSPPSRPLPRP
jgi:hypothetical protein